MFHITEVESVVRVYEDRGFLKAHIWKSDGIRAAGKIFPIKRTEVNTHV